MIKEAIQYIISLKKPESFKLLTDDSREFVFYNGSVEEINQKVYETIPVHTLLGLVDLAESEKERGIITKENAMVLIVDENCIQVIFKNYNKDLKRNIIVRIKSRSRQDEKFDYFVDNYHNVEEFRIKLATYFANCGSKDELLEVISKIETTHIKISDDDGISQEVTTKDGIARKGQTVLPKYVSLAPFRSFTEIEPVEEDFLFRIRKRGDDIQCALFKTGSNQWQLEICKKIKEWLNDKLPGWDVIE